MGTTEFFKPKTIEETLELLNQYNDEAVIVNGGTDIVEKIGEGKINPQAIVYIKDISELNKIREENGKIIIGGAVTYEAIETSKICNKVLGLIQAVSEIGSPPVRVVATPAGNLGTAAPASDCNVMMLALGAEVLVVSKNEERIIKLEDFFIKTNQTVLKSNELIKEIIIPEDAASSYNGYVRLARRKAQDIAKVLVGVSVTADNDICKDIKISLGALNAIPIRAYSLESMMIGKDIHEGLRQIRGIFPKEAKPRKSRFKRYKELVTNTVIQRAIKKAYGIV